MLNRDNDFEYYKMKDKFPVKPVKPFLSSNETDSDKIRKYADDMDIFNKKIKEYHKQIQQYNEKQNELLEKFWKDLEEEACSNNYPEKVKEKLRWMAYESGHHAGYSEIVNYYYEYCELAEICLES